MKKTTKRLVLLFSIVFLLLSIYYFQGHINQIGMNYDNMAATKFTGETRYTLEVKEPAEILLLHNVRMESGSIKFEIENSNGELVEEYKLSSDKFLNKSIKLEKGTYTCSIIRNVYEDRESFRIYYDKRFISQEYIVKDSNSSTES